VGILATATLVGCGTASDISGSGHYAGAVLSESTFGSAVTSATSRMRSVHVNGSLVVQGQHVTFSADAVRPVAPGGTPSVSGTINAAGLADFDVRLVRGDLYLRGIPLPMLSDAAKPWVKIPLEGASSPFGDTLGQITGELRPDELWKVFQSASQVNKIGPENIDSIQTMHYQVSVDLEKARTMLGVPDRPEFAQAPKTITYDVWRDAQNRPTMVSIVNPRFSMNLTFSNWNEPVRVVPPPSSQVGVLPR